MQLNKLAFTLIELLVVIAVIGILSGLIVVSMSGTSDKATIAKAQIFSNSLRNSIMLNLVSEWRFDGPTSPGQNATIDDFNDSWGNNNTGIVKNGNPVVMGESDCISGKCLNFNGTTDYINCGTGGNDVNVSLGESMTTEAWIKLDSLNRSQAIVSKWTPWIFFVHSSNKLAFYNRVSDNTEPTVTGDTILSKNKWYYTAVVYKRSDKSATFYLNGVQDGSKTFSLLITNGSGLYIQIGGYGNVNTLFDGLIDNVRLYNVGISGAQIKENYYFGLNNLFKNGGINKEEYLSRINEYAIK